MKTDHRNGPPHVFHCNPLQREIISYPVIMVSVLYVEPLRCYDIVLSVVRISVMIYRRGLRLASPRQQVNGHRGLMCGESRFAYVRMRVDTSVRRKEKKHPIRRLTRHTGIKHGTTAYYDIMQISRGDRAITFNRLSRASGRHISSDLRVAQPASYTAWITAHNESTSRRVRTCGGKNAWFTWTRYGTSGRRSFIFSSIPFLFPPPNSKNHFGT